VSRKYTNPPILEALCEFQFVPSQPWDMTIPGFLYEKINHEFPRETKENQRGSEPKRVRSEPKRVRHAY